jgi:phage I-like protein
MERPIISILLDAMPARGTDGLTEIPIAVTGTWKRGDGEFSITREDLAMMTANFRKRKNGEVNVDYDHASEMPEVGRGGPVLSAGRIVRLRSNGAAYASIEFTARALELIKANEYRFVSSAIVWGMKDKTTGKDQGATLTSLALTNRPFLEELPSIKLSEIGATAKAVIRKESTMEPQEHHPKNKQLCALARARAKEENESFATALVYVARANPQLTAEARTEVLGRKTSVTRVGDYNVTDIECDPATDLSWVVANLARERAAEKGIGFSQALSEVSKANPALIARYRAQVLGID